MKFVDLAQHLHELRAARTGRPIGAAMTVFEVWNAAIDCTTNGISEILYFEAELPRPFDGMFFRLNESGGSREKAVIFVDKRLEKHWKQFVAIKEMMHCWSPGKSYVGTADDAKSLVEALSSKTSASRYTQSVAADNSAILAAGEVILPHFTVERYIKQGMDFAQIAFSQGLHPDIAEIICRLDMLHARKSGQL
jgi:hypothetical protein